MFKKILNLFIIASFVTTVLGPLPKVYAAVLDLPAPGSMVNLSPAYMPVMVQGLKVHPDNPLLFDFIMDTGKSGFKAGSPQFKAEAQKLIKYFLASLTIKEDDLWVNLSPYEKSRITTDDLGKTGLGRDMLAQDYILKQLTASLIYPERKLGKEFWDRVYAKVQAQFGSRQIPVNTFNKVWVVADKAKVLERNNVAYVIGAHLKVMLEEDYLALQKQLPLTKQRRSSAINAHTVSSQIIRQIILPEIEKEVNQGKNFAQLRQIFYSMILATWYKRTLKDALLNQVYSNKGKTSGVLSDDLAAQDEIYNQYLKAYKKGVFNYIKEDMDAFSKKIMPRKYFSGGMPPDLGIVLDQVQMASLEEIRDAAMDSPKVLVDVVLAVVDHQNKNSENDKAMAKRKDVIEKAATWKVNDLLGNKRSEYRFSVFSYLENEHTFRVVFVQEDSNIKPSLRDILSSPDIYNSLVAFLKGFIGPAIRPLESLGEPDFQLQVTDAAQLTQDKIDDRAMTAFKKFATAAVAVGTLGLGYQKLFTPSVPNKVIFNGKIADVPEGNILVQTQNNVLSFSIYSKQSPSPILVYSLDLIKGTVFYAPDGSVGPRKFKQGVPGWDEGFHEIEGDWYWITENGYVKENENPQLEAAISKWHNKTASRDPSPIFNMEPTIRMDGDVLSLPIVPFSGMERKVKIDLKNGKSAYFPFGTAMGKYFSANTDQANNGLIDIMKGLRMAEDTARTDSGKKRISEYVKLFKQRVLVRTGKEILFSNQMPVPGLIALVPGIFIAKENGSLRITELVDPGPKQTFRIQPNGYMTINTNDNALNKIQMGDSKAINLAPGSVKWKDYFRQVIADMHAVQKLPLADKNRFEQEMRFIEGLAFKWNMPVSGSVKRVAENIQPDIPPGGIDLNAKNMGLDVTQEGKSIEMKFNNSAMIAQFRKGNFTGVEGIIIRIVPIESSLPVLGMAIS